MRNIKDFQEVVNFFIATIHLHLKSSVSEELVDLKFRFQDIHNISQCCNIINCTDIIFDKFIDIHSVDWFDKNHNYSMILQAIVNFKTRFFCRIFKFHIR